MPRNVFKKKGTGVPQRSVKGYLDGHPAGFIQNYKTGEETSWKAAGQFLNPDKIKDIIAASAIKNNLVIPGPEALKETDSMHCFRL